MGSGPIYTQPGVFGASTTTGFNAFANGDLPGMGASAPEGGEGRVLYFKVDPTEYEPPETAEDLPTLPVPR